MKILITIYAGITLSIFSLNLALTNDYVPKEKFVAAGGGLQLIFGIGAISGPILCSLFMEWFGLNGFFVFLIIIHVFIGVLMILFQCFCNTIIVTYITINSEIGYL